MYTFILFWEQDTTNEKEPQLEYLHAFILSKIESTIEHLLSRARQKYTRSYHNSVSRHHPIDNSLEAFPLWVTFVQSTLQCFFLGSHQYQKCPPPPSISHLQWHSWYYSYDHIPMSQFHSLPGPPCRHTLNKGSLSLPLPPQPLFSFSLPSPPPQFSESVRILLHTFWLSLALLVKETSFPWLEVGLPLLTPTHIFQRIDPEVPVPWFH